MKSKIIQDCGIYHDGQFWLDDDAANKAMDTYAQQKAESVVKEIEHDYIMYGISCEDAIQIIKKHFNLV